MFEKVAIANRGEIAVRVIRTLRRLGIGSVALYSDADVDAAQVRLADEARRLGGAAPRESYLHVARVVESALAAGADALHPGYGFLSESVALARACADAGITFVGPNPEAISAMGDKIRARDTVASVGVPVVPGRSGAGMSDDDLAVAALDVGLPLLLKPSAGGGGKGMRLVTDAADLLPEIASSRREALAAFGDDTLLLERFVSAPRHIEIQVAADHHDGVVHLGERECSLQRRHQKIVEESPSPFVSPELRQAMGAQAVAVARACAYTNVGTVELIVAGDRSDEFYFMEMNTRLQVEHPVTEEVYGVDLVELQLRIAAGEALPWRQEDLRPHGHAVEARVYAEDPANGFLPTGGRIRLLREPAGDGVRVDAGWRVGMDVGSAYDPMLAKVITSGATRQQALDRLRRALGETTVLGVTTNVGFLRELLAVDAVRAGVLDTGLVERTLIAPTPLPLDVVHAAWLLLLRDEADDLWNRRNGWRLGGGAEVRGAIEVGDEQFDVRARWTPEGWLVGVDGGDPTFLTVDVEGDRVLVHDEALVRQLAWAHADEGRGWIGFGGNVWQVALVDRHPSDARGGVGPGGPIVSPMPGSVVAVLVRVGDIVGPGAAVAVIEAMKMEHTLTSEVAGVVAAVHVRVGDQVAQRRPLVEIEAQEEALP